MSSSVTVRIRSRNPTAIIADGLSFTSFFIFLFIQVSSKEAFMIL